MSKRNNRYTINAKKITFIALAVTAVIIAAFMIKPDETKSPSSSQSKGITEVKDNDIIISVKDVTETATFYPAEINGTKLEVIAVKASDGSIRTAFNTCQVCFNSGRGYYKQEGEALICQNCGNRFRMDDIEVTRGGCNPVPITDEYKSVNEDTITISKDFLMEASVIFERWK